jgi:hypothetical protein
MIAFSSIRSLQDSHHPADCGMHASDWGRGPVAGRAQDDRKSWGGNFRVTVLAGLDHVGFQVTTTDGSAAGHHTHHHGARSSRGDSWELLGMRRLVANIYNTHTHVTHTYIYITHIIQYVSHHQSEIFRKSWSGGLMFFHVHSWFLIRVMAW